MQDSLPSKGQRLRQRIIFFAYITAIGLFSNWLTPTPYDVVPFLLGNMAISVITQRLGWSWGLATTALVLLPIFHVELLVFSVLQYLMVYCFARVLRWQLWRSIVVMTTLSVPCMLWVARPSSGDFTLWGLNVAILVLTILNNEWGAHLVIRVTDAIRGKVQPFKNLLANRLTVAMASPLSVAALLALELYIDFDLQKTIAETQRNADDSANIINHHIQEYRGIVSTHAAVLDVSKPEQLQKTLDVLGESYPEFITLLITDAAGTVIARYPRREDLTISSVDDRDYFRVVKETSQIYFSGVFQGRGFGHDIITAISAPVQSQQGEFAGVLEGSLEVSQLNRLVSDVGQDSGQRIVLQDAMGRVIFSSSAEYQALQDIHTEATFIPGNISNDFDRGMNTPKTDFLAVSTVALPQWRINVIRSYQDTGSRFAALTAAVIAFCIAIMAASRVFAGRFSHFIGAPLDRLVHRFRALSFDDPDTLHPVSVSTPVAELHELASDFNALVNRLTGVYGQLRMSLNLLDTLNQELENRVSERTADLLAARDRAEHLAEVKSSFLANMSHELRTPLTAIIGFSAEALRQSDLSDVTRDALQTIQRNSQYLLDLIGDILDASKLEFDKLELEVIPYSPIALVRDVCKTLRSHAANKHIALHFQPHFPLPRQVLGDPIRVKQILFNLLSNSIKFTEQGSVEVHLFCDPEGIEWTMQVVDTGIGMTPEQQRRLFQPFMQADESTTRRFGGTGLGLFICKQLINRMSGNLMLESQAGRGSRFTVCLPTGITPVTWVQESQSVPELEAPAEEAAAPPAVVGRILVAEDVEDLRKLIVAMIARTGADVVAVSNGAQARDAALNAPFDLIFMDMHMPVLDGIEAVRELRTKGYHNPIVALTADVMTSDIAAFEHVGCDRVLAKPINEASLMATIVHYLPLAPAPLDVLLTPKAAPDTTATAAESGANPGEERATQIQQMLIELGQRFLERLPGDREFLLRCLAMNDRDGIKQRLHQLKGAAGSFGFPRISEVASQAYQRLEGSDSDLTVAVQRVLQAIDETLVANNRKSN